ncbi:MAG: outer membrane beta-barrel protein [Alistipes sp.]
MRKILLSTLLTLLAFTVSAQTGILTATVIDAESNQGISGAVIEITPLKHPDKQKYLTSGYKGSVKEQGLAYGKYKIAISFIGYDNVEKEITLSAATYNMGKIMLVPSTTQIATVVKEVKGLRTSQKGDTVSYSAKSFKVANDADVEGLLKKMPGITITDGAIEAQGETVKKIYVDGKEFFGEDVSSAIKSLPAQAVDKVEVYNKMSDAAEFSGMDDGEGFKAINIVTHENMRRGQFGQLYAGYGYDADTKTEAKNKYIAGGNVNVFSGDSRLSVIGLFNNVNQQNFSFEDILGVTGSSGGGRGGHGGRGVGQYMMRPQSGVASVNAIGLNYSDTWGKRKKLTFQGSYFFNNSNTTNISTSDKWYEAPSPIDTLTNEGYSETKNFNHRLNGRLEWKISENQNLMIRPSFSYQSNDPLSTTHGFQFGQSGYNIVDNYNEGSRNGYNARLSAIYRVKLGKPGRTVTVDASGRYSDNGNNALSWSNQAKATPFDPEAATGPEFPPYVNYPYAPLELRYQRISAPSNSYDLRANIEYTEPVAKYAQLSFSYRANYQYEERDKKSYTSLGGFDQINLATPDPLLSNAYSSGYMIHRVGPGFRYAKEKNTFVANVYYQNSTLDGQVVRSNTEKIKHSYNDVTYFFMGQININRENMLRLYVRSYTENPEVQNLQNIYDVSNTQYISKGNPDLRPSYTHSINFHYVNSNMEKGRTFMWMLSMQNTSNYIANSVEYNKEIKIPDGTGTDVIYHPFQYSQPENMDGYWNLRTYLSYGLPIGFLKSNLNLSAGVNYAIIPSMINGERNDARNIGYDAGVVLGSNISENIDFTLSWNGTYNEATNSLASSGMKNRYFNHMASGNLRFVFWKGFTFTASAAYTQYIGFSNNYDDSYVLCNAFLGKKVFKNQRGEISIGVNDLFNQNQAFVRTTGSGWTQNATNSVIGRYYMVKFVYNLRRFGKNASTNMKDYDGSETLRPKGGMRMPGGMMRPPMRHH